MTLSKRNKEIIEARRNADPIAQALGRDDIDYSTDELPTAPRHVGEVFLKMPPQFGFTQANERVVEVDNGWYAALCEYLHPVERMVKDVWLGDAERVGIVFIVPNPERSQIVFIPKRR